MGKFSKGTDSPTQKVFNTVMWKHKNEKNM